MYTSRLILAAGLMVVAQAAFAQAPTGSAPAPAAAPTASTVSADARSASAKVIEALQKQTAIRSYQWTETMLVSVDGKAKSTVVNTCNYNPEGGVSRTPAKAQASVAGGTPGTAHEIDSYVESAVAVMRGYVRPKPEQLQACLDAGRVSLSSAEAGHQKLEFRDFLKRGDHLSLVVDPATSEILSSSASTYVINVNDRAEIHTEMSKLPDGISYPSRIKFDTPGRQMGIVATDSDYKKKTR